MSRKTRYNPTALDHLETRVVLSHAGRAIPVVTATLQPSQFVLSPAQLSIVAQVNQAFMSFQSDFDQARATYYASIQSLPSPAAPATTQMSAFNMYTTQRVELLAQQLLGSFLQGPAQPVRPHGVQNPIQKLIATKIIEPQGVGPEGSLAQSLKENISMPGATAPTEALNSLSQDIAIATAQTAVINEISILKVGAFGNMLKRPHKH